MKKTSLVNTADIRPEIATPSDVQGMTLNCIHIFIVTGSLFVLMCREASQSAFLYKHIYLRILIISYLATFLGTNSLSMLMRRKAVNQSINLAMWPTYKTNSVYS